MTTTLSATAASGGSSPSREVQEILSLKDSDCLNEFYDDPSDLLDDNDIESLDNKKMTEESYNFNETCCKRFVNILRFMWPNNKVIKYSHFVLLCFQLRMAIMIRLKFRHWPLTTRATGRKCHWFRPCQIFTALTSIILELQIPHSTILATKWIKFWVSPNLYFEYLEQKKIQLVVLPNNF